MRILISMTQIPFVRGGAEILAEGLLNALRSEGHEAEIIAIPFKWYPPECISENMLACQLLDITNFSDVPIDLVIGLKFPAYLIPHPNKVYWIIHQHRAAYDLWDHPLGDLIQQPSGVTVRDAIRKVDCETISQSKRVYTISKNVSKRLSKYCSIDSIPLYHPPSNSDLYFCENDNNYLFFPSRISELKRQTLVIQALAETKENVMVKFAGIPDTPITLNKLQELAKNLGIDKRITWMGQISEDEKRQHYAGCTGVIYPPIDEDYGYVTLEAMLSSKPVITCHDSGGPLEFVLHRETGLVADPEPKALAAAMDELWLNKTQAKQWGSRARCYYQDMQISWRKVIQSLLS
jgi:glycosyltransferase involved in cell wall biosynthesis